MRRALPRLHDEAMESANPLLDLSNELARAVEIGAKAVFAVHGRPHVPSTGILWRADVLVTTDHTLKRDEDITVTLPDGRNLPATVAGRDSSTDIAVLRLAENAGDAAGTVSDEAIKPGNLVLALGRRGADGVSASFGIVSAVAGPWRTWRNGRIDRFLRPDVSIYTGFSGGPLVDMEGRVIGLNTTGLTRGAGITIPASTVSRVLEELLSRGHVRRGFLGIGMHPVELPGNRAGLVILSIEAGGPAALAGIVVGDVLLSLNGDSVSDTDAVQSHLGPDSIGKPLTAGLLRGGAPIRLDLTPAERPVRER
jgi:S1-C subfamily serine protease